jgi:hypothetical protein
VFEKRVLMRISGPKRKWREAGEDCIMRKLKNLGTTKYCYSYQIKEDEMEKI